MTLSTPTTAAGALPDFAQTAGTTGTIGGSYEYLTLGIATDAAGAAPAGYVATPTLDKVGGSAGGVLSQGLNPNTLAENKPDTWVKNSVNAGARQNFAYLGTDITVKANYLPTPTNAATGATPSGDLIQITGNNGASPYLPARLSPDEIQYAPIKAGASGKNMGAEDSFACTDGGSADTGAVTPFSSKTGNKAAKN